MTLQRSNVLARSDMLSLRLARFRNQRGLSKRDLAQIVGIDNCTLSRYERNLKPPSIDHLFKLAAFYGYTYDELLGGTEYGLGGSQ
jgi:transcriptional regulator with XRE-family HTH domain